MPPAPTRDRIWLDAESWYSLTPEWLPLHEADDLLAELLSRPTWGERAIVARGVEVMQPRLVDWEGELPYKYSGQVLEPRPLTDALERLTALLRDACDEPFNHALLNLYRDGRDSVAMHADNEPELGITPTIASLSLGAARRFKLEHKHDRRQRRTLPLEHGTLVVMGGAMQRRWRHAVPRDASVDKPRVNVTLRTLLGPPGWRDPRWGARPVREGGDG
ncbi:MAG: alpha-ketoglutarate-dependent dioxygenase AlkB [Myxococcales bacterium]|nr:alpha-ketoglutarate-dependent dioxygenase AlkB [Myxococcales bacterium]MCB9534183.1 alpha-ketoglutarate-dependent dioxygenase AlkB [Myxococcales bacterium]